MYHMIHINPTLLHQTNDDTKNVCEKNRSILTVINVWRQCIQVKHIILPIFGKENKLSIQRQQKGCDFREKIRKIVGSHRQYQTGLIIFVGKSLA